MAAIAMRARGDSWFGGPPTGTISQPALMHTAELNIDPERIVPSGFRAPPGLDPPRIPELGQLLQRGMSINKNDVFFSSNVISDDSCGLICDSPLAHMPVNSPESPAAGFEPPTKIPQFGKFLPRALSCSNKNDIIYTSNMVPHDSSGSVCRIRGAQMLGFMPKDSHGFACKQMAQMPAGFQEHSFAMPARMSTDGQLENFPPGMSADGHFETQEFLFAPHPHRHQPQQQEPCMQMAPEPRGGKRAKGKAKRKSSGSGSEPDQDKRWWTRPQIPLLCPLTKFPISLLPYPPFKLRVDPALPSPHKLVDGKSLAIKLIANGSVPDCGRQLEAVDVDALDDYMHRCKLGPFRPGRAMDLAKVAATCENQKKRNEAARELNRLRISARIELGKLRRIQESRLEQVAQNQKDTLQGQ